MRVLGPPASGPATTGGEVGAALYKQRADVDRFAIEASARVSPFALAEANWLVAQMIPADGIRALAGSPVHFVVMGASEMLTDLPEYASLVPKVWWDHRFREIGPADVPVVACGEENLLDLPGDPHANDSSCVHGLAHAVGRARAILDPTFPVRFHDAYARAMASRQGTRREWFTLRPGDEKLQDVYAGHVWFVELAVEPSLQRADLLALRPRPGELPVSALPHEPK